MRSNHPSKSTQINSRLTSKYTQSLTMRPQHNKQLSNELVGQSESQIANFLVKIKPKDADQWIFGDQKLKIDSHNPIQNFPIRGRIAIHRKERVSKHTFNQEKYNPKTAEEQATRINYHPAVQSWQENQNHQKTTVRHYSRPLINQQQDNKLLEISISKEFTQRYSHNTYSSIRNRKHINTSMEIYSDLSHFLKPTAFSIQLKKPLQYQERARSAKKDRMNKTINSHPNSNISRNKQKINNIILRQSSARTVPLKKVESNNVEKQLNGWEVESSMFHDFDQLYREKSSDLQKLPLDKQQNIIKRKIVKMPIQ